MDGYAERKSWECIFRIILLPISRSTNKFLKDEFPIFTKNIDPSNILYHTSNPHYNHARLNSPIQTINIK